MSTTNFQPLTEEEALGLGLPKWPQMRVTGESVTAAQAKEIIFATDRYLTSVDGGRGGNDSKFDDWFKSRAGFDLIQIDYGARPPFDKSTTTEEREAWTKYRDRCYALSDAFSERMRFLPTEYVHNSWAHCAYIYGPYGWCAPTGRISFSDNVGKWPNVGTIAKEWTKIAARWPFLSLWVTLMDREHGEEGGQPVVTFHVQEGQLKFYRGTLEPHADDPVRSQSADDAFLERIAHSPNDYSHEHGLPLAWITEYADRTYALIQELIKDAA